MDNKVLVDFVFVLVFVFVLRHILTQHENILPVLFLRGWNEMSYLESTNILKESLEKSLEERKRKWWEWHKQNPMVYELFEKYTFDAIETGRKHYSHWAIINRIRWDREIETQGGDFKI